MTKHEIREPLEASVRVRAEPDMDYSRLSDFGLRAAFVMRHSPFVILLLASVGHAQTNTVSTNDPAPAAIEATTNTWSFGIFVSGYLVPDSRDYVQPTFTADRGWLHLEARYNYESLDTGSVWLGYNLGGGDKIQWSLTPMFGGVFGELNGIAPGYKFDVSWWKLGLYSEGEYAVDLEDREGNFFYNWSEFSVWPVEWFRVGMVTQRTRLYDSDRDIQRGFLLGVAWKRYTFTTYVFNPGEPRPSVVLSASFSF